MAAPQIAGTPAPAPKATPPAAAEAEPVTAATHGLDAILDDLSSVAEEGEPAEAQPETESEGTEEVALDQETAEKTQKAEAQPNLDELLFSEEALGTKEGVKKAAGRLKELRQKQHEAYLGLKGYEKNVVARAEKLKTKVAAFRSDKQTHQLLIDNVRSNLQGLHSNDPEVILTALGNLTGTDGLKAYELLTSRIINRGDAKVDPQIKALLEQQKREIDQLKQDRLQEREQAQRAQLESSIQSHAQKIGDMVRTSTTTPNLTRVFNENPARLTNFIIQAITEDNGATPAPVLFAQMEAELQQHLGVAAPQGTNGGTVKQPQRAQRSPGQSIGPRTAVASTSREPSEAEALKALSEDTELMRSLGLQ
jgi:hypothetical protein